jgi:hypothetical protein
LRKQARPSGPVVARCAGTRIAGEQDRRGGDRRGRGSLLYQSIQKVSRASRPRVARASCPRRTVVFPAFARSIRLRYARARCPRHKDRPFSTGCYPLPSNL